MSLTQVILALPKILAGVIMIHFLNIIAITLSIYGGYMAGELSGDFNA